MIDSIKIKEVASFDSEGIEINDLRKVNFIYGANGSGKTTISNLLLSPSNNEFENCNVAWNQGLSIQSLVYNKSFKDANFGKGEIDGVFTIGNATKEQIEEIELKSGRLKELKEELVKKKRTLESQKEQQDQLELEFKEAAWSKYYKEYETPFKEAYKGTMQKSLFAEKLIEESKNNSATLLGFDELIEKAKTIFGDQPVELLEISQIQYDRILEIAEDDIWQKRIIGKSDVNISKLIHKLNHNDWVNEGQQYLQDDKTCPFCQEKTITESFRNQLENYFDEEFMLSIENIKKFDEDYDTLTSSLINILNTVEESEKNNKNSKLNITLFSSHLKTLISQVAGNKTQIKNKVKEPSRSLTLTDLSEGLIALNSIIESANEEIRKHNIIVKNFNGERIILTLSIWKFLTEKAKVDLQNYSNKHQGLNKGISQIREEFNTTKAQYSSLDSEIKELSKNVTSVQPAIDEINKTLKSYGFTNFEIVPAIEGENQYQIKREDGELAESTLSEGEITFITFLYFLQLAKGGHTEDEVNNERILVIDDPISSLDSNILFVVSSLIKEIIKEVKSGIGNINQILILTHNVYFHKEVSFIDGRTQISRYVHYWILRKNHNSSSVQSFEMKNPIQTSYQLLWQELKEKDKNSGVTIQNIMRRIIENYFKILGNYGDDDLIKRFENKEDQAICRSLICWINDGSHSIADDLFIEVPQNTVDRYFDVFERIFSETNHTAHYNMMMGIEEKTLYQESRN